jgi:thiosulfate/3-mercaptopyruvate sulfurtransferase
MSDYKHPEVLVSTEWAAQHLNDGNLRFVEVDVDTSGYTQGHIAGAVGWNWQTQLQDNIRRDLIDKTTLEKLLGQSGISNDTTIVLYGDNNNWFAAYAFWQLKYNGHKDVRLLNGGRKKWLEEKRTLTTETTRVTPATYRVSNVDESLRAHKEEVFIPWSQAANEDGTFKSVEALEKLYQSKDVTGANEVITYCRIGERSSHTWFVLKYLLGYDSVRNYDGSWTEWGNLVGAPIANPTASSALSATAS